MEEAGAQEFVVKLARSILIVDIFFVLFDIKSEVVETLGALFPSFLEDNPEVDVLLITNWNFKF
jgi:hypothetical protein